MAIAFVQNPTSAAASAVTATTGSATWTTGNTIVVTVSIRLAGVATVSSITQSAGTNTYTFQSAASGSNTTTTRIEIWTATNITGGTFSISANLSVSSKQVVSAAEYSGVQALGNTAFDIVGGANPSISLTTQDPNNFIVAGFTGQGVNTFTAGTSGSLRGSAVTSGGAPGSNVGGAEVDNTVATPGTLTVNVTNADNTWAKGAIELRSVVPAGTLVTPRSFALLGVGA